MSGNGARGSVSYVGLMSGAGTGSGARGSGSGSASPPHPSNTAVNMQTGAKTLKPRDFGETMDTFGDTYGPEDRDNFVDSVRNEGLSQRESARSRGQQLGNYAYNEWNLAQNNPRGNLNGMSYLRTLRYSRLADMLNNQYHYRPGHQQLIGTGKKGIMQQADTATVSRWDPIETEEMRQMKANRELDMRARQAGVDLQSRIQAYPQEIQEALDESTREMRKFIAEHDVQFIQDALKYKLEKEYGGSWEAMFEMLVKRFDAEMELEVGKRIWDAARWLTPDLMRAFLAAFGRGGSPIPDYFQQAFKEGQLEYYNRLIDLGVPQEQAAMYSFNYMPAAFQKVTAEITGGEYTGKNPVPSGKIWGSSSGNPQDSRTGGRR